MVTQKLDEVFPQKVTKLGIQDTPFMNSELKKLKRKRMREYRLKGKSARYERLKAEFEDKFKKAGHKFLRKNIDRLKETNPSQAYNILKKMGAQPGDIDESNTFTLPGHEDLSPLEAADKNCRIFFRNQ